MVTITLKVTEAWNDAVKCACVTEMESIYHGKPWPLCPFCHGTGDALAAEPKAERGT